MSHIIDQIKTQCVQAIKALYHTDIEKDSIVWNATRKEFEGDFTVVVFPFAKAARKRPEQIGEELGQWMVDKVEQVHSFNVIKGFLNLRLTDAYWFGYLKGLLAKENLIQLPPSGQKVLVEFSSPNTNKPLHLGHIRNILLGWSCANILKAAGDEVVRTQIVNDRGIAICKSMVAWQRFGKGETPENTGIKGDHLVGKYYVAFEQTFQQEYKKWQAGKAGQNVCHSQKKEDQSEEAFFKSYKNHYFNDFSELGNEAKDMLLKWEANDPATRQLWNMMNSWVYQGFEETYQKLGVQFDQLYYESETYLLGKQWIEKGLEEGAFYQKEDGSVWVDLESAGLDQKIVLRSDGTSLYMTQDIGTAQLRYEDHQLDKMIYVVADEQNYHFQVLFEIMKRFGVPYANGLYHLSYGMVDLPSGRMKSREGTVVDADDLIADVIAEARNSAVERGEIGDADDQEDNLRKIGLAALKYFIIKVNPRKRMVFDPKESVDLQGQTGPYIQYSYVRIQGLLRKAAQEGFDWEMSENPAMLQPQEKELIRQLYDFPACLQQAAKELDPSHVAQYCYNLAKAYHKLWHDLPMLNAESEVQRNFRLRLSQIVGRMLAGATDLLGIEMPERM